MVNKLKDLWPFTHEVLAYMKELWNYIPISMKILLAYALTLPFAAYLFEFYFFIGYSIFIVCAITWAVCYEIKKDLKANNYDLHAKSQK